MIGVVKTGACYTLGLRRWVRPRTLASSDRGRPLPWPATMRVAMIASECEPYAKTGGLADVVDALSRALGARPPRGLGHAVDVYLPWYRGLEPPRPLDPLRLEVPVARSRREL